MPKKRNPNQFTTEEIQTATLLITEGSATCWKSIKKGKIYPYPSISISMCDREALIPASKTLGTKLSAIRKKEISCPPHLFPPDGKGIHRVVQTGEGARKTVKKLEPLLTTEFKRKWKKLTETCP